ncbi:type VI secretion system tube protein Hcp [Sphingomonas sp. LB-2]|uniref:Hcp family type VI secretion system effector n=1 Tax=Sphingomonas caeni TaxID=2984949 RepID=UPI002231AB55|nr:type VI secretion system tube protein Hcp [Sphingomonas caeni]MCW3845943.1 type VI secretion system tube protein Hcp [Sphingomonas caeni]
MAATMYLKLRKPDIAGGSHNPGHVGEIEVLSWSHGFSQPASPTRSGPGTVEQASHTNLTFSKYPDSASTELLKLCWNGKQIGKALLSCYRSDEAGAAVRYLEIELSHVIISNFSVSGGPGDLPVETIALDYGVVAYRYYPASGRAAEASHDLIKNMVS